MDHFTYIDNRLHCEDIAVDAIAEAVGTPCYVYSRTTLTDHFDRLASAFAEIDPLLCYSIKSSPNVELCRALVERGAGMDLVSGGELHRALRAGVDPARCVYAGVGKTDAEITAAIEAGVGWLNIESEAERCAVARVAESIGTPCRAALRVNPDVDANTHRHTTTGIRTTKFGVSLERVVDVFEHARDNEWCRLEGLHLHIGSPVYTTEPYVRAIERTLAVMDELDARGMPVRMLDLGGGFGADYETGQSPPATIYAEAIVPLLAPRVRDGLQIVFEPGRTISANAGVLLLKVLYVKESGDKRFLICDGGMNVLLRPSHYEAFHFVWPTQVSPEHVPARREEAPDLPGLRVVDVVGPVCETGDYIALDRAMPPVEAGQILAVFSAGAYGMSMASRYNSTPLPAEVLVSGDRVDLIRRRESLADLTSHERAVPVDIHAPTTVGR